MVGLQLGGAFLFLLLAIWRLRPIFRRQEESTGRRRWFRSRKLRQRRGGWFAAHPECGDDPIAWKERYFAPVDRFTRFVLLPAIIVITLPLALVTEVEGRISSASCSISSGSASTSADSPWANSSGHCKSTSAGTWASG